MTSEPEFTVGAPGLAEPGILFASITTMEVLSSGRLAVADGRSATVSVFDTVGAFLHSFGGQGEGPGEMGAIFRLFACAGDTVMVRSGAGLVSVFDGQGRFIERLAMSVSIIGISRGCDHIFASRLLREPGPGEAGSDEYLVVRTDRRLLHHDTIAEIVVGEAYSVHVPGRGNRSHPVPWTIGDLRAQVVDDEIVFPFT